MSEQSLTESESEYESDYSSDDLSSSVESDNDQQANTAVDTNTCCICLDDVSDDSGYKLEQCGHLFHTDCIVRNIQQGNIACPCCRKLPLFVSDVTESYDLREDLIHEYNEEQKKKLFKKATRIVTSGDSSKALTRLVLSYKKVYDKVQSVKQKNKETKKIYDEMNKELRVIENEQTKEYKEVRKKYDTKRREIKKKFKCKKIKRVNYRPLNDAFEKVIKYMGYRPVEC